MTGSGRSLGEGNGYSLQNSCLENFMDRGAWRAMVHGVAKSQTRQWLALPPFNWGIWFRNKLCWCLPICPSISQSGFSLPFHEQGMLSGSLAFDKVALEVADFVGSPGSSSSFSRVARLNFWCRSGIGGELQWRRFPHWSGSAGFVHHFWRPNLCDDSLYPPIILRAIQCLQHAPFLLSQPESAFLSHN